MKLSENVGEVHVEFTRSMLLAAQAYLRSKNLPSLETAARALLRQWAREGMAQRAVEFLKTLPPGTVVRTKDL
jgi:hypothetical protein